MCRAYALRVAADGEPNGQGTRRGGDPENGQVRDECRDGEAERDPAPCGQAAAVVGG